MQAAQMKLLDAKRILKNAGEGTFLKDELAADEAELDAIFNRLDKRICEFSLGRPIREGDETYRPTSPASCGTVCRGCKSHIGGDQPVYGGLCLMCATAPADEKVKVERE
jgi:hypothetical protein